MPERTSAPVQNGTAQIPFRCQVGCMLHKKIGKKADNAQQASVKKEMAEPRMARSARIAELKLDAARTPEHPSTTMPGIVKKIIPPQRPSQPEKAQVKVGGADQKYREFRFENTLTDEHGEDVKLKKGAHVDVTITEDPKK